MQPDDLKRWKHEYQNQPVPGWFTDRVMQSIGDLPATSPVTDGRVRRGAVSRQLTKWLMVSAASVIACLRIAQVVWLWVT